jgi:hypothetical protein
MTDDEGLDLRWDDLSSNHQAYEEAIQLLEAHNRAEEAAMPPKVKRAYRKAVMRGISHDIENDAFLTDLERDVNQEVGDR